MRVAPKVGHPKWGDRGKCLARLPEINHCDTLTIATSTSQLIVTSAHYRLQRILGKDVFLFLFVTQAFWVFIVRICFFWCAIWVNLKSLSGSPACDCVEHRHLGR